MRKAYEDRLKLLLAEAAESSVGSLKTTVLSGIDLGVYGVQFTEPLYPHGLVLAGADGSETIYPDLRVLTGYFDLGRPHTTSDRAKVLYKPMEAEPWFDWPVHYDTSVYVGKWILMEDFTPRI